MNAIAYPKSVVWYVEARSSKSASETPNMGSAVAIWLQGPASNGDVPSPRKYLLTCSHVVRDKSRTGGVAAGTMLGEILCWPAGRGYVPIREGDEWPECDKDGIWTGKVIDVFQRPTDQLSDDQLAAPDDWVLIDIQENDFQDYHSVQQWSPSTNEGVSIIGFPAGASSWNPGTKIEPYEARDFRQERSSDSPAMLLLEGPEETAGGMSGGGLFDQKGHFIGLHRSQSRASRSMGSIAAVHIQSVLVSRGYRVITTESPVTEIKLAGAFEEFKAFLGDVKSVTGLATKFCMAAPFLDLLAKFGPPLTNRALTAFAAGLVQFIVLMLLFESNRWRVFDKKWLASIFVVGCLLSVLAIVLYSRLHQTRVHTIDFGTEGKPLMQTIVSGHELTEAAELYGEASVEDLVHDFGDPSEVWTSSSIQSSKNSLWNRWILMWFAFATAYGSFILLQQNRKREVHRR